MKKVDNNTLSEFIKDMLNPKQTQDIRKKWHRKPGFFSLLEKNLDVLRMFGLEVVLDIAKKNKDNDYIYVKGPNSIALYIYRPGDVWV